MSQPRYFALHKPYGMLSQFSGGHPGLPMLSDLPFSLPEGIHAVGRLDFTSEGLLLLTTDGSIIQKLFDPAARHPRSYLVNVYRRVSDATIGQLAAGVSIRVKGGLHYTTAPAIVSRVERPASLPRTSHELRADIAQDWLCLTLTEGKFRQVRKMLHAVLHPCHRLIRLSIGGLELGDLRSGELRELGEADFHSALGLARRTITPEHITQLEADASA